MNTRPSSDIDVLKYEESLKTFLRSQSRFTDYDFEGSNFSVLISLLAKNAYDMAHYGSMVGNEAWIDTAELRQSLVSHATDLNYLPRSMSSAQATLEVEVFPTDTPLSIILPKYYRFKTTDPSTTGSLYFVTDRDYVATRDNDGRYIFKNVLIYQGDITEEYFLADNIVVENNITLYPYPFVISSENIDINSLEVFVKSNETDNNAIPYRYARTLAETTNQSQTYFIRGIYDSQYSIEFGDGTFGAPISNGNQIIARYRNTLGSVIQGNYQFSTTTDISGYNDIVINSTSRVISGYDRESLDQIRLNAPRFFQTQDRAVTYVDYETIVKANFPNVQQVSAFGGEEIGQYGKVFIIVKPYGITGILSNTIKNQIIELLKTKNIVPEPIIMDPNYFYIGIHGNVFYSGDNLSISSQQLETNITTDLVALNNDEINGIGDFRVKVYQSLLNNTIRGCNQAITGSDVTMDLRKRWRPALNINETLSFNTHNAFKKSLDGRYRTADDFTVISSIFQVFVNDAIREVVVQDDGIGNLYYYAVQEDGTKIRTDTSIGSIDYDNGTFHLVSNVYNYEGYIEFIFKLENSTFQCTQDTFVIIDGANINVDLIKLK